jgi:hypothetical protein
MGHLCFVILSSSGFRHSSFPGMLDWPSGRPFHRPIPLKMSKLNMIGFAKPQRIWHRKELR